MRMLRAVCYRPTYSWVASAEGLRLRLGCFTMRIRGHIYRNKNADKNGGILFGASGSEESLL